MIREGTGMLASSLSPTAPPVRGVVAIVLAAGRSSRMGSPKPLLRVAGRPLLQLTLDGVPQSQLAQVVVVLGQEALRVRKEVSFGRARVVVNPDYAQGLSTSIRAGVRAAGTAAGYLFVLGDKPFVSPATYDAILRAWRPHGPQLVIPRYRGQRGNPVLVDGDLVSEMEVLTGDAGFRALFLQHAEETLALDVDDPGILVDFDLPGQLRILEDGLRSGRPIKEILAQLAADVAERHA
jgi:molybdenum cofactor cytidylyltransferase